MIRNDNSPSLVGLIVPPAHGRVPSDAAALYPDVRFIARGLGLEEISPTGFDAVIDLAVEKARELADAGATAISLMGTSISFYRGAAFNRQLASTIHQATGLPATTMSYAVVRALRATGVRRVALATAYIDDLNRPLISFLEDEGFEIAGVKGLAVTDVVGVGTIQTDTLLGLAEDAFRLDPGAEGVLLSCGGLMTLGIAEVLEPVLGVPVISSSPAGFWDVVQLAAIDPRRQGFGRLFHAMAA